MNNIKEFLNKYQFEDIQIEHRQKFRSPYYGFNGIDKSDLEYFLTNSSAVFSEKNATLAVTPFNRASSTTFLDGSMPTCFIPSFATVLKSVPSLQPISETM